MNLTFFQIYDTYLGFLSFQLVNCLTSKESELWNSLGEPWYVPENEWKGYVAPFRPVFTDGWRPSNANDDGPDSLGIDEVDGGPEIRKQFPSDSDMEAPLPPPPAGLLRTAGRPGKKIADYVWL
jgi:hypothetical protein